MTVYVEVHRCTLDDQATEDGILPAGLTVTCPDCGRTWGSQIHWARGADPVAEWVCLTEPPPVTP